MKETTEDNTMRVNTLSKSCTFALKIFECLRIGK